MFKFLRKLKLRRKKPLALISVPEDNKYGSRIVLTKKPKNIEDLIISHIMK